MPHAESVVDQLFTESGSVVADTAPATTLALTMPRGALRALIDSVRGVVPTRDVMPVLKYIRLAATEQLVTAVATDMEMAITARTTYAMVDVPGTVMLPAAKILDILRSSAPGDVRLRASAGRCRLTIGRTSWTLSTPSGADFPTLTATGDAVSVTFASRAFFDALDNVRYAAKNANRPGLAQIEIRGGVVSACDGTRFAQTALEPVTVDPIVLPLAAAERLAKFFGPADYNQPVVLTQYAKHIAVDHGDTTFLVTRSLHPYPDLSATLLRPALENRNALTVNRRDLGAALDRVRVTADPEHRGIALHITRDHLTVASRDPHGNATTDELGCLWNGPARTITVNHQHLVDLFIAMSEALEGCGDDGQLTLWLGQDTRTRRSPVLVRDDAGTVAVIQQMHLDWADQ